MSSNMSYFATLVHQASMSYIAGRILTIFLKREFSFDVHTIKDVLDVLPAVFLTLLVDQFAFGVLGPVLAVVALLYSNFRHRNDEMPKTLALWASVYAAVYADFDENTFACLALAFATTQFLRKPDMLMELLSGEPKIICGLVYVILVCAGLRFCCAAQLYQSLATVIAAFCSLAAAVLFRPDIKNNETLRLLLPESMIPTTDLQCQVAHGLLLFSGFLITFLKVVLQMPRFNYQVCIVAVGFGIPNIADVLVLQEIPKLELN